MKLEKWRKFMGLADMKLEESIEVVREHPWEQFKYSAHEGLEPEKNEKLRHKKKKIRSIKHIDPNKMIEGEKVDVKKLTS